jgi:hypothetical protein
VKTARVIRVVGTARQDVASSTGTPAASAYLKATESRFASGQPLSYLRITSPQITPYFKEHLTKLFSYSRSNKAIKFEVALTSGLDVAVSYMVFDDDGVLLIVDNEVIGQRQDNQLMLWSAEPEVVKAFKSHFDHAWSTVQNKVQSNAAFQRVVKLRK